METNNYCWSDFYFLVFWRSWKLFKFALNMVHVTVEWWKNKNVVCVHLQTPLSFFFSLQLIQSSAFYWSSMHYDAEVTCGRSTRTWGNNAFGGRGFDFFSVADVTVIFYCRVQSPDVPYCILWLGFSKSVDLFVGYNRFTDTVKLGRLDQIQNKSSSILYPFVI